MNLFIHISLENEVEKPDKKAKNTRKAVNQPKQITGMIKI